jgi:hypothetical protein
MRTLAVASTRHPRPLSLRRPAMQIYGEPQIPVIPGLPGLCSWRTNPLPISSRRSFHSSALIFSFHEGCRSSAQCRSSLPRSLAICRPLAPTTPASSQRSARETRGKRQRRNTASASVQSTFGSAGFYKREDFFRSLQYPYGHGSCGVSGGNRQFIIAK